MTLLDEEKERWYCYKDDEVFLAKEHRWIGDPPASDSKGVFNKRIEQGKEYG
jgi:hypothetical protein